MKRHVFNSVCFLSLPFDCITRVLCPTVSGKSLTNESVKRDSQFAAFLQFTPPLLTEVCLSGRIR